MPGNSQYLEWEFEKLKKKSESFVSSEVNPVTGGIVFSAGNYKVKGAALYGPEMHAAAGDSLMAGSAGKQNSPYYQARAAGQTFADCGNFAVGGTRSDQIAAQIPLAAAAGATVLGMNQGANDIAQGVPEATLRANVIANIKEAYRLGMSVIDVGLPPTNTSANVPRYVAHEVWRKLYCYKNGINHVDSWSAIATGSGGYKSGMNADAVHWSVAGAKAASQNLLAAIQNKNVRSAPLLAMTDTGSDAGTYFSNVISFTDDNADGIPNSWVSMGAGGTYSIQPADANGFGKWFRCAMSGGANVGFSQPGALLTDLGWNVGDKIAVGYNLRWVDVSGALTVYGYFAGITPSVQPVYQETGGANGGSITVYEEATITAGTAVGFNFFASGTGYFEINRPIIVNLTKLGLA